ncbi:MAG: glycogen/starch synthase [Bacteroidales bacterium]|nr:glycogen/starch synthase [Bacteroidales bacterium]MBN2757906.1 glycogen/starch synthase [Bacteroidales bacterium]
MEKTKILFVSQEITPYLPETEMSKIGRYLPQGIQELGKEIRAFMPRYGLVNERRNQLHEVIRLSGMNIIIDDTDHSLIIKVASIQSARMQVYFIDNEDYFHRKNMFADNEDDFFKDNDERAIFFSRGVLETVKKLRWSPDIIHCHGWITSLIPLYIKKAYHDDPLFQDSKVVYSVYDDDFKTNLDANFRKKLKFDNINSEDTKIVTDASFLNLSKLAINNADAIIKGSPNIDKSLDEYINNLKKPVLDYKSEEEYVNSYSEFYDKLI